MIKDIFLLFFKASLWALGGGFVFIGVIDAEIKKKSWNSLCDVDSLIAITTSLPGPIITNLSYLIGKKLAGITGGLAAVTGSILPPFIIIYFLAPLLLNLNQEASRLFIESFFYGGLVGVAVFVFLTALRWIKEAFEYGLVSFASFILMTILMLVKVHPLIALFVGFSMNMLLARKDKDA
ncbi:MAG: chromate transporter [Acetomicrobium sp.]|uniref:chromate transporter n=1 Tax=Acetomicrobium sp. TaxID=1872099 RepID=UPI0016B37607|nr:chromate transporter [Acetomicrobium sp.]NLI42660.1 chromate transporter [Synergistaceae bacterium]MBP8675394.1 chromate transporter [Acetomicrobium sp.]MDR9770122.1 chromate transporter [Acetomicrobium sp.]HOB11021.1 chromate transporter [Acetomicrobium sp.]HQA36980.1 chromate transporter [Acetomicrobium sp.]